MTALPLGVGRYLNQNIAIAEAIQLIGAFSAPHLVLKASPKFAQYMEPDGHFHGAYGARIRHQTLNAISKLREDINTRRAIITLWDPVLDNQPGRRDYPCTVALQFEVHNGALCMNTFMRSNDVWLGLPYDLFQFTQLQLSVANALSLDYGWYRHTTLSMHIYEEHIERAKDLHAPDDLSWQPVGVGKRGENMTKIMQTARRLTLVNATWEDKLTPSEEWYRERFAAYLTPDVG